MDTRNYFVTLVHRLRDEATAITAKAETEGRDLSADENLQIEAKLAKLADYKSEIKRIEDRQALKDAIDGASEIVNAPTEKLSEEARTLGDAFVRSLGYKALKERGFTGTWSTGAMEFPSKLTDAGLIVSSTGDGGGNLPLQPQLARGPIHPAENPLSISALFSQGVATQNTIVYLEETTTTPGVLDARYSDSDRTVVKTVEGAAKPAAAIDFTKRSKQLQKLAAFLPVSDEMLEDEPSIVTYINARLGLFIRQAEDAFVLDELLASNIGDARASDLSGNNWFDAIAAGIRRVQQFGGVNPDAILMHPVDFWTMSTTKASTSGDYFGGSPYRGPQDNPWGIPVVVSAAALSGNAIIGAFKEGGQVWHKGGISVEASNSHSDYFRKNLTAIRAEERLALTVYRPSAFTRVAKP